MTSITLHPDLNSIEEWWLENCAVKTEFGWKDFALTYDAILPPPSSLELAVWTLPSAKASLGLYGDNDTYLVGTSIHAGGAPCVYNDVTWLVPELQKGRIGTAVIVRMVRIARILGLNELRLQAREIGPYAWTRLGFVPRIHDWNTVRSHLRHFLVLMEGHLEADEEELLVAIADDDNPEAFREVLKLNRIIEDCPITSFEGISIMRALLTLKGIAFEAVLDIRPGRSWNVFAAYLRGNTNG